ncbi:MAG: metallophosphoesterase family protein [Desulfopila sp.]|nr:metallophosphoesterase family protein [Desulfopila sp.]
MKILTVSDTVADVLLDPAKSADSFKGIDLIISCGDLPPEYLSSLRHRFDAPLMYVLGNHDLRYTASAPVGCDNIDRRIVSFNGYTFVGFSGSRWYNGGMNQYSEKEMGRFLRRMRFSLWRSGAPHVVVTHAPPRYIHDAEDPCHKGFKCFVKFIEKYSPAYFIHGHIHRHFEDESDRITIVNTTRVINSYGFHVFQI